MPRILFDIETDNLLPLLTKGHCAVTYNLDRMEELNRYDPSTFNYLYEELGEATEVWGHNIISYDFPALKKLNPEKYNQYLKRFEGQEGRLLIDTMVLSRAIWPDIQAMDFENMGKGLLILPEDKKEKKGIVGSHSLKAWGYRLGLYKGKLKEDESGDKFARYTGEMLEYNARDVRLNAKLVCSMLKKFPTLLTDNKPPFVYWEHQFYVYLEYQQKFGVKFAKEQAEYVVGCWQRELDKRVQEMRSLVPDIVVKITFIPKANNSKYGYVKGEPFIKTEVTTFNPRSRQHVTDFLINKYGWKPAVFTKRSKTHPYGQPAVTYEILKNLPYPEAPLLARIILLMDRIGLVATEKKAWLKCISEEDGRIHGGIIHNGTNTHRCKHFNPNLGNIISFKSLWGKLVRSWFISEPGFKLIGEDFDAQEMRNLAEVLYPYDGGAFYRMAFNGRKEDGTDPHSLNVEMIKRVLKEVGLESVIGAVNREKIKQGFYAFLYGAYPTKLGSIVCDKTDISPRKYKVIGEAVQEGFKRNVKGLEQVIAALEKSYNQQINDQQWPHITLADGRRVPVRKKTALLNTLLQSMGAALSKIACALLLERTRNNPKFGLPGDVWRPVLHVHDEIQVEVYDNREIITEFTELANKCFSDAGRELGFTVPVIGTAAVGNRWSETH